MQLILIIEWQISFIPFTTSSSSAGSLPRYFFGTRKSNKSSSSSSSDAFPIHFHIWGNKMSLKQNIVSDSMEGMHPDRRSQRRKGIIYPPIWRVLSIPNRESFRPHGACLSLAFILSQCIWVTYVLGRAGELSRSLPLQHLRQSCSRSFHCSVSVLSFVGQTAFIQFRVNHRGEQSRWMVVKDSSAFVLILLLLFLVSFWQRL